MYPKGTGHYYRPLILLAAANAVVDGEVDIGASSGTHGEIVFMRQCRVKRCMFVATSEAVSGTTTPPTVVFKKRPTPLSSSGQSTICTLTIPSGQAVGKPVYKDFSPVSMEPGQSIEISWTVGVGTPTGIGMWHIEVEDDPETPANQSNMTASA